MGSLYRNFKRTRICVGIVYWLLRLLDVQKVRGSIPRGPTHILFLLALSILTTNISSSGIN